MPKVLFVISTLDLGGAQKLFSMIMCNLPQEWETDILLNSDRNIQFPYRGNIISLGMREPKNRRSLGYQTAVFLKRLCKLRKLKAVNQYDFVISAMDSANVVNILSGNKHGKVLITIMNNMTASTDNWKNRFIINPLIRVLYNKADLIVAQSHDIKQDIVQNFGIYLDKIRVAYSPVSIDDIDKIRKNELTEEERAVFDKDRTIITAGRLDNQKGQWHLIRAFSEVVKTYPDANLVIFGTGNLKEYLVSLIREYGLEQKIFLYGFSSELVKYISNSAIFAFPSVYEGFGIALQEAMVCKVPCVCTDYQSGAREILQPDVKEIDRLVYAKYGIMVPNCGSRKSGSQEPLDFSEKCMADALMELLDSTPLREDYAKKARERAADFDIHSIMPQWLSVFGECIK